jgi:hypothetical protein
MRDVLRERFLIKFGIYIGINLFQNVKNTIILNAIQFLVFKDNILNHQLIFNPHQNDQGRKGPCFFQRLIALKCLKCQKIKENI